MPITKKHHRKQSKYRKQHNKHNNIHNKTRKQNIIVLPNNTPKNIDEIRNSINEQE